MQAIEVDPVLVSFHFTDGTRDEKTFDNEDIARGYIEDVMFGRVIYQATIDGLPAYVALNSISGAIIHLPVAQV